MLALKTELSIDEICVRQAREEEQQLQGVGGGRVYTGALQTPCHQGSPTRTVGLKVPEEVRRAGSYVALWGRKMEADPTGESGRPRAHRHFHNSESEPWLPCQLSLHISWLPCGRSADRA